MVRDWPGRGNAQYTSELYQRYSSLCSLGFTLCKRKQKKSRETRKRKEKENKLKANKKK